MCQAEQRLQRQRSSVKGEQLATVRGLRTQKSEQAHQTMNRTCLVHHRTVRWPHMSDLQRSKPNGLVTWLAYRTVSGGAPDCPVLHATEALTNGSFGGWGYKYPPTTTLQCIQVFSLQTTYESYSIQYKDTTKEIKSSPKSKDHSNQIVTRERETCVHLSSCAWIASFSHSFL